MCVDLHVVKLREKDTWLRGVVSLGSVAIGCNSGMVLSGLGLSVGGGRFVALLNPSNYNGAAALHYLTNFIRPGKNSVIFRNGMVGSVPPRGHGMGAVFRHCTLFSRVGIFRGITFNPRVRGVDGDRVHGAITRVLRLIGLGNFRGQRVDDLSNNRRREITVTHTLTGEPRILLLSRPLNTLSLGLHGSVRGRLGTVRGHLNVAFVCIARSRRRTLSVDSHIIIVSGNGVRRVNAPRSVCGRPMGTFITSFVNRSGVISTIVVGSCCIHVSNIIFSYLSGKFRPGRGIRTIVHPRSVGVRRLNAGSALPNGIASIIFGNAFFRAFISINNFV